MQVALNPFALCLPVSRALEDVPPAVPAKAHLQSDTAKERAS